MPRKQVVAHRWPEHLTPEARAAWQLGGDAALHDLHLGGLLAAGEYDCPACDGQGECAVCRHGERNFYVDAGATFWPKTSGPFDPWARM